MFQVTWMMNGGHDHGRREFQSVDEAVAHFEYLVYEDGQSIGVGLNEVTPEGKTFLGTWDPASGVMWSTSDRRAADASRRRRDFEALAFSLTQEAEAMELYARNMTRAAGGDEPDAAKVQEERASVLRSVARAARSVAEGTAVPPRHKTK